MKNGHAQSPPEFIRERPPPGVGGQQLQDRGKERESRSSHTVTHSSSVRELDRDRLERSKEKETPGRSLVSVTGAASLHGGSGDENTIAHSSLP